MFDGEALIRQTRQIFSPLSIWVYRIIAKSFIKVRQT